MQTLNLKITPVQKNLERNAHASLEEIADSAKRIIVECERFRGTNDNRFVIVELSEKLAAGTQELMAATDEDLIARDSNAQVESRRMTFIKLLRKLQKAVPHLASEEEGVSPLSKKIKAKLAFATGRLQKGELTYTDREAAALDVGDVQSKLEEIRTLDPGMDPWQINLMMADCTHLIDLLRGPLVVKDSELVATKQIDLTRLNVIDLLYLEEVALRPLGRSAHGGRRQVEAILKSVCELSHELRSDRYAPIDVEQTRTKVLKIQTDLQLLNNVQSESGSGLRGFFVQEAEYARSCIVDLLKTLQPQEIRVNGGFEWAS